MSEHDCTVVRRPETGDDCPIAAGYMHDLIAAIKGELARINESLQVNRALLRQIDERLRDGLAK